MSLYPLEYSASEKVALHLHSDHSDGQHSPEEIIALSQKNNMRVISITDHASVDGVNAAIFHGANNGVYVIPGVELNSLNGDFAGYFIDHQNIIFLQFLENVKHADSKRIRLILSKIGSKGYLIDENELLRFAYPAAPRRTHLARLMVQKKYFDSVDHVFNELLGKDRPGYIPSQAPLPEACINAIRGAGGLTFMAHPFYEFFDLPGEKIEATLIRFKKAGLIGIEYDKEINPQYLKCQETTLKIADALKLMIISGSNFHGKDINNKSIINNAIDGYILKKIEDQIPESSLNKKYLSRLCWRANNLTKDELQKSLSPDLIEIKELKFQELLERPPIILKAESNRAKIPFLLMRGDAINKVPSITKYLEEQGCPPLKKITSTHYRELAWDIYDMARGNQRQKMRDLLKFNLDDYLWGSDAAFCVILFFENKAGNNLIELKRKLRHRSGAMRFYRVCYNDIEDIHFTSLIHISDEKNLARELYCLNRHYVYQPNY